MRSSTGRQAAGSRCAWRRWQESWYATVSSRGCSSGRSASTSASVTSSAGTPRSFRCDPQPDALTTIVSVPANARAEPLREPRGLLRPAGVRGEGAAAALARRDDVVAGGRERPRGCGVDVAEQHRLDAAGQEPDASGLVVHRHRAASTPAAARASASAGRGRASAAPRPVTGGRLASGASRSAQRSRRGYGSVAKSRRRWSRSARGRLCSRSTTWRVSSISRSYWTPEGQLETHAMQPRQRSKCSTTVGLRRSVP